MIAMVPQSKNTPPTFYHVTWKADQYGKWKTLNSPPYTALFRDLRSRNPMTETLHIQLHGSDFAKLPLSAGLRWLIEFPPELVMVLVLGTRPGSRAPQGSLQSSSSAYSIDCQLRLQQPQAHAQLALRHQAYHRCSPRRHRQWNRLQEQRARHRLWLRHLQQRWPHRRLTSRPNAQLHQCPLSQQLLHCQHRR